MDGRILGLDYGSKTIGVAVSDQFGWTAQPVETIYRRSCAEDMRRLVSLVHKYDVVEIVVGMPLNMDGTVGSQARFVNKFVELLKQTVRLPVVTWDERCSTNAVTRILLEADVSRRKRRGHVDKMAAAFILQGYLDYASTLRKNTPSGIGEGDRK